ncbi:sulfite exporter TauE/SafE family protein [Vannielia sp.]|uniref:sulfite exporter TauE/SafE family protein n=1 Tax=Vannielia sp. TaxID=2813045 RepID=UPI00261D2FDC|nr:sulfite exporter TauE/SafE family protein [Vannielia sp.]MDF1874052.1 sulfite exporter TauE/SafE family protein [Vannielia sp.]
MTLVEILLLVGAGFAAGLLNAVAGGGTFLSLPALIYIGLPPVSANATATLIALPGYISSAWGFRHDMQREGVLSLWAIAVVGIVGSVLGALLLIITPGDTFLWVVPWLLLLATMMFAFGPRLLGAIRKRGVGSAGVGVSVAAILAVSVYGGYFNGGLGIMLLATFGFIGYVNLHGMNGLKNVLSAVVSLVSAVTFVAAGLIAWKPALVMAVSATIGGYLGARLSRRIVRTDLLRHFVTGIGLVMAVVFFLR